MGAVGAAVNVEGAFTPAGVQSCFKQRADDVAACPACLRRSHIKLDVEWA